MPLHYSDLNEEIRLYMLKEINLDISSGNLYMGVFLSDVGRTDWPHLILGAARNGDDRTLAAELSSNERLLKTASRKKPRSDELTTYKVPITAPEMLAEGEFNRFYVRGLCCLAIEKGISHLVVYRAKHVSNPRSESETKIGSNVDPRQLIQDLRTNVGVETALGIPPGPNSGLSVRLP